IAVPIQLARATWVIDVVFPVSSLPSFPMIPLIISSCHENHGGLRCFNEERVGPTPCCSFFVHPRERLSVQSLPDGRSWHICRTTHSPLPICGVAHMELLTEGVGRIT